MTGTSIAMSDCDGSWADDTGLIGWEVWAWLIDGLVSKYLGFNGLGDVPCWLPSSVVGGDRAPRLLVSILEDKGLEGRAVRGAMGSSFWTCLAVASASSLKAILNNQAANYPPEISGGGEGSSARAERKAVLRVVRFPRSADSCLHRRCTRIRPVSCASRS